MKVSKDCVVSLEYRLHLGDGNVIDESEPGQPLAYMHGRGQLVPGLEGALEGLSPGDAKQVVVPPAQGYGEHDARGLQEVPRGMFPPEAPLAPGLSVSAQTAEGEVIPITVREVRPATAEELAHGHAHGPGGAH
jgi:FKBP-type peptidyl-prolyl cis-trans isomerase SlyD